MTALELHPPRKIVPHVYIHYTGLPSDVATPVTVTVLDPFKDWYMGSNRIADMDCVLSVVNISQDLSLLSSVCCLLPQQGLKVLYM